MSRLASTAALACYATAAALPWIGAAHAVVGAAREQAASEVLWWAMSVLCGVAFVVALAGLWWACARSLDRDAVRHGEGRERHRWTDLAGWERRR